MGKTLLGLLVAGSLALGAWAQESEPHSVLMRRAELPAKALSSPATPSALTVPADTEVSVEMLSGIHTRISRVNDLVTARLLQPVYVNGHVVLPSGSLLDGRITMVRPSGRMHRPAELGLKFESVLLPDGRSESMAAVLSALEKSNQLHLRLDAEGHLIASRDFSWKSLLAGFAGLGAFGGIRAASASTAALSKVLPMSAGAWLGFEMLVPRGRDVNLPPDTLCRLRLNYPLTVRVAW